MSHPIWYSITDVATLRAMLDQKDQHYRQASDACNRVADERNRFKRALSDFADAVEPFVGRFADGEPINPLGHALDAARATLNR